MSIDSREASWSTRGTVIVDGVTLDVVPGSTVGLLGPNGSGKSSLLRLLAGLRPTSSGVVRLGGDPISSLSRRDIARRLAFVEQESTTDADPTVRDVIGLGRLPHRAPWSPESANDRAMIASAATTMRTGHLLDRSYMTLSGGERQRVQIARALAQEPTELLLDEPTNHLDVRHQLELLELVRATPTTTLMALHDLNHAATYCDRLVVLAAGRVHAAGVPAEVLTPSLIAEVYGVEAVVEDTAGGLHVRYLRALPSSAAEPAGRMTP
ncbi:ABC transporter ATP-binding protein [Aeromicrobium sp. Leaf350]|uniref:ABC transporter ATP-binding protein n=1 Tax=Aeromicrobium sp. Leaf350 TaxID=2876565 RepID=UPI001E5CF825|nr:ABC transporter ATP-binding protein [Aeromicrobium sp. Leaf350]